MSGHVETTRGDREAAVRLYCLLHPLERQAEEWHREWVETGRLDPSSPSIPWRDVSTCLDVIASVRLAAERRGYERGVRDASHIPLPEMWGACLCDDGENVSAKILDLLAKEPSK